MNLEDFLATQPRIEIIKDTRKVMIISYSPLASNYYAHKNGWESWEYVSSPQSLRGVNNIRIAFCGQYRNRNDISRLREIVWELESAGKAEVIIKMEG